MAFNQLTDEQIDDEILRMVIEESTNMTNIINNDDDEILHTVLEESKKSIVSENFEDIVKKNDKFLSETINKFNKLQNIVIEKTQEIEKIQEIEKTQKIEDTPLTLEQLREKRLKRFTQV